MRLALIGLSDRPAGHARLAGRSAAEHQLALALDWGADHVVFLGDGASPAAVALRHEAEGCGAKFTSVRNGHALVGIVGDDDLLLVLQPGLIADLPQAVPDDMPKVLSLPSGPAVSAGFERIDLASAWAGMALITGRDVARLEQLPVDSAPHAALLRIALQARLPLDQLPAKVLAEHAWFLLGEGQEAEEQEAAWIARRLPSVRRWSLSERLAAFAAERFGAKILAMPRAVPGAVAAGLGLAILAVIAAGLGFPATAFALTALAVPILLLARHLMAMNGINTPRRSAAWLPLAPDAAIAASGILALSAAFPVKAFLPLVTVGIFHVADPQARGGWPALVTDRMVLAALFLVSCVTGVLAEAFMAVSLGLLALHLAYRKRDGG